MNRLDDDPHQSPKVCPDRHRWNEDACRDLGTVRDNDEQSTYDGRQEQRIHHRPLSRGPSPGNLSPTQEIAKVNDLLTEVIVIPATVTLSEQYRHAFRHIDSQKSVKVSNHRSDDG